MAAELIHRLAIAATSGLARVFEMDHTGNLRPAFFKGTFESSKRRTLRSIMMSDYFITQKSSGVSDGFESATSPPTSPQALRSNHLSSKVASVLSASYVDSDIRDALTLLDQRGLENNAETRRQLRLDVQKEVIESNGDIIREFGHVAEVCTPRTTWEFLNLGLPTLFFSNSNVLVLQ